MSRAIKAWPSLYNFVIKKYPLWQIEYWKAFLREPITFKCIPYIKAFFSSLFLHVDMPFNKFGGQIFLFLLI